MLARSGSLGLNLEDLMSLIKTSRKRKYIYHFTDADNLKSIETFGILSKEQQPQKLVFPRFTGGDSASRTSDKFRGIYNDVSLCLTRNHQMAFRCRKDGRHPNQIYFGISPDVLKFPGVRVALGLANAHTTKILPIEQAIPHIDIELLYTWVEDAPNFFPRMSALEKIEVLVPICVPREMIKMKYTSKGT